MNQIDGPEYTPGEEFNLPPISILVNPAPTTKSEEDLESKAQILQATLKNFGLECKVGEVIVGPTVTLFAIVPAPGVKISSITDLASDIALAMAAQSIRIEAPIPGRHVIGIEIPNRKACMVALKTVLESKEFQQIRSKSPLAFALGQDIAGVSVVADLRKMPHLLITGATGSGKTVCIGTVISSILLSATPTEVKLLLVDPKGGLQKYDGVPHLLAPVVTDVRKAPAALKWAVDEIERRYQSLARADVRDIESFNTLVSTAELATHLSERMPYIVIIVDEYGDLMMIAAKECEDSIMRIAQMARAVGIHLIIATQRPSTDVITGVIKANLPSCITFQVFSKTDSRNILGVAGAEQLLGQGDMLYKPGDRPRSVRVQGCFISDTEIHAISAHYASQGWSRQQLSIGDQLHRDRKTSNSTSDEKTIAAIVKNHRHCSIVRSDVKNFLIFSPARELRCNRIRSFFIPLEAFRPRNQSGVAAVRAKMEWKYGKLEGLYSHILQTARYSHIASIGDVDVYHIRFWNVAASGAQNEAEMLWDASAK